MSMDTAWLYCPGIARIEALEKVADGLFAQG